MADTAPSNDPLDEAFAAYLRSCDAGQLGSRDEFLAQFPELQSQLRELMEAADMIGMVTGSGVRSSSPDASTADAGAETIALDSGAADDSGGDPAVTLPMPHRATGDPGPRLPFDLGDYLLLEVIGRGGMGVVYLAKQTDLDRMVAVKMIRSGMLADDAEVRRFYTEAQAAARLHHPGIVAVFQFGCRAGHHFFSMEYVSGTDLQRKINGQTLQPAEAARYVRDVARAIHHAHQKGVLHRDLKPANVLIDQYDDIHVTDFGLAKHVDSDSSVTGSGAAVGTPHYMAPEQAGGYSDRVTRHSDVYALGAILFAGLTGRPPIVGDTVMQTLMQVVHQPAPPVRSVRSDVPVDLETIICKCLEKNPAKRYDTAAQLADELDAFLEGRPIEARPRSRMLKMWHWLERVPLVAALSGRRVLDASATHRRFQAAMLLLLLLTPLTAVVLAMLWQNHLQEMPSAVRFAGGVDGGVYNDISQELAERLADTHAVHTDVIGSGGSLDNRQHLMAGDVDVAPMQATAISGDTLRVVAPLFYEILYVLARDDGPVHSIDDLRGRRVVVGPEGSGSRATAELVFDSLGFATTDVIREVTPWQSLHDDDAADAAMICIGRGSPLVSSLIADGGWRLIAVPRGIQIALQHPTLRPMSIEAADFPDLALPAEGIPTVGTTAFLAAVEDAPDALIVALLDALYANPPPCRDLIPRHRAAEWQGLAFHRAARHYYQQLP